MRKVSALMSVLVASVVFLFGAVFFLAAQDEQPALRSLGEAGTTNAVQSAAPAVPKAPPVNGKNASADDVVEISVISKTGAPPEFVETKSGAGTNLITVAFDNVPVQDVVNMFAQISGANIIMAGSFTNLFITANLKNVEWKSALNLALGSVNLSVIEDPSGILMVVTSDMYPKKLQEIEATKPLMTRTMVPRYLNAVDLVEQIKLFKVLSPRGSITTSQSAKQDVISLKSWQTPIKPRGDELILQNPSITTAIVITDIKEYVDKVEALILVLDKREPQVFIEARIINVASASGKKTGVDWSMLDSFGLQAGLNDLTWNYNDSHSVNNSNVKTLDQHDNRNNVDTLNQSYDNNGQPNPGTRTIADTIDRQNNIQALRTDTLTDTLTKNTIASASLTMSQVQLILSALENNDNAEMISHPQLVVGNRVEAKIHVGKRLPVLPTIKTDNTQAGSAPNITYSDGPQEIIDLGITLWVIPEIDFQNNTVRLTIRPETATHNGDVVNPQTGKSYPIVDSRDLTTRINVPSGQTVAIAGLIENQTSKVEIKVPILGDIPLLGVLFRHTDDQVTKNNLIIMITPTILDDSRPLTGLEAVAQQTIDKYEKIPLAAVKAVPSNTLSGVTIGTNAVTPTAGMGRQAEGGLPTVAPDAKAGRPSSQPAVLAPVPAEPTPTRIP